MGAIFRPQIGRWCGFQPKELSLAWKGSTGLIPHVKMYLRGLPHRRGHVHHLVGLDVHCLNKLTATLIHDAHLIGPRG